MIATLNNQSDTAKQNVPDHTDVQGRFNQYTSGFWALALPALSARYIGRFIDATGLLGKVDPHKPSMRYAAIAGSWMLLNTGLYAERTYSDMKRMLAETVAYETGKNPNDVGLSDFRKSDNEIVHRTMSNFFKRTALRTAVGGTFFSTFLMPKRLREHLLENKADAVDLGVGVTGAYLYSDVIGRKVTFFEALQNFIDRKINHADAVGEVITDNDLMNLYATHMRDGMSKDTLLSSRMDTVAWKQDQVLFGRMADLMNKTYKNTTNDEGASFNVPKLLYLLGHELISRDNIEQSLAYIEIANKFGIPAVKKVQASAATGMAFSEAAAPYYVAKPVINGQPARAFVEERGNNYVERLSRQEQLAATEVRTV